MNKNKLIETHILGKGTTWRVVRRDQSDAREWLAHEPICPLLERFNILHVGIMQAGRNFEVVRRDQSGTFFMVTISGEGDVLTDGHWQRIRSGFACLLPPHTVNAIRSIRGEPWSFCWVRYLEPKSKMPMARGHSPVRGPYASGAPLEYAVRGLYVESQGAANPAQVHHWVDLIQQYVLSFAQPQLEDERLYKAWEMVCCKLDYNWSLEEIASSAHVSTEHLRRLCLKHLGRSPMKHLTYLRMRHAAELLSTSDDKVETVAHRVGYENPFSFSNTFRKWTGFRPSEFRG